MAAMIRMTATTISNSMSENPLPGVPRLEDLEFSGCVLMISSLAWRNAVQFRFSLLVLIEKRGRNHADFSPICISIRSRLVADRQVSDRGRRRGIGTDHEAAIRVVVNLSGRSVNRVGVNRIAHRRRRSSPSEIVSA